MATRTALVQLAIGWVLFAIYTALAIAGISNAGRPLGYHLAIVNWAIIAIVWAALYLGLYASPGLFGRA
jgi:Kef-type K+ transport system membrane component KefB